MSKTPPDPYANYRELTFRGMLLGALITVVFTASNIYLGLKVGLTVASSIPAAVISMAALKFAKGSNILENNIVQTQASSAGTLSTVIFVLPGLLMTGYWNGFPFWQTTLLCVGGGILGVIFTVPLRYAMVVKSNLPYPEGVAAAEILKVGSGEHNEKGEGQAGESGIKDIAMGGLLAGLMSFLSSGLRVISDSAGYWFKAGSSIFQLPMGFSLALLGAGYLVGLTGGIAILVDIFIAWGGGVPYFSAVIPQPADMDMSAFALQIWKEKVRFIGAGTIGIASIWTLITLAKPMIEGMKLSFKPTVGSAASTVRTERDLSPKEMIFWALGMMLVLGVSFYHFVSAAQMSTGIAWLLVVVCTLLTLLIGFLVAAACGYMAGLVGSSSSPISGIGIISVIIISLVLLALGNATELFADEGNRKLLLALTLFCGSSIIAAASISNDNLQDLKTGYLVKATPRLQQIALIIGCIVGSVVISPVLQLLYEAYGFTGAMPRPNMDVAQALAAPQATLMSTIAQGIFTNSLQWSYIFIGMGIGAILIIVDLLLKKSSASKLSLPVLAVGMGIYLPPAVNMPIVIGAFLVAWMKRRIRMRHPENTKNRLKNADRIGTLFSAGLIVGESLVGVIMAFIIAASVTNGGSDAPLAIKLENWDTTASWLGLAAFILGIAIFAKRVLNAAR
ncbi:MAG: oligopeptide transporter, OPT family [Neisseria sp.]|uniref:OPT family oligopeptide transporter n=1 Tax=Neisseria sp. TaxID=192066 RepID=UPI0026DD80BC|nr:oligopeptide transporter, OPT family [Neisseria sp.]MDO4641128.1 oligopeptide transporter, OPT family [Neisseria sp.]